MKMASLKSGSMEKCALRYWQQCAIALLGACVFANANAQSLTSSTLPTVIQIDANAWGTPFPHFWETVFGSGRAALALRDDYRKDLRLMKSATGIGYVRFHAIFHDEVGLYSVDKKGNAHYNFTYIDQIYDGLLAEGVRPFVELSFMPQMLAKDPKKIFGFWYKPNISPPQSYARWDEMIRAFTRHLIERYGIDEVAQWYFEVWNEPNAGFWGGDPYQPTYFELYDHTARTIKSVSPRLRVGGPSTAQAAWVADFIDHCQKNAVPVDFVSSHVYANDDSQDVFRSTESIPRDQMVCRAVRKNYDEIKASSMPHLPLIYSEYNASYANEPNVTDTIFMGPWLASTISQCDGLTQAMSHWTFSDVFEENGVVKTPFYGGYGIIAEHGIPKPAYQAYALLHRLGNVRLPAAADSALITKRDDGTWVIALWNYAPPGGSGQTYTPPAEAGPLKSFELRFTGAQLSTAKIWRVDQDHGNVIKAYDAMGRPAFPDRAQIVMLRAASQLAQPEMASLDHGSLTLVVPALGLAVVEIH